MIRLIRIILGYIILGLSTVFRPRKIKRSIEQQKAVDIEASKLTLYQFHLCPFCIRVRRTLYRLNLSIELRDAKYNTVHRQELLNGGGKIKVPCLRIKEGSKTTWLYQSADIIAYLNQRFL